MTLDVWDVTMDSSSFELTLEQSFHMQLMERSVDLLTREQIESLFLETSRLLMLKENIIKGLMRDKVLGVGFVSQAN
jgi:Phycobilisome degradation protein nblA